MSRAPLVFLAVASVAATVLVVRPGPWPASANPSTVVSDNTWKFSRTEETGWQNSGFDDSTWGDTVAPSDGLCPASAVINPIADPMWAPNAVQHETVLVRKTFVLNGASISGSIRSVFDDDGDLYVNGSLVRSDRDGTVSGVLTNDVSAYLVNGMNVIAIRATDTFGGCQSIQLVGTFLTKPGPSPSSTPMVTATPTPGCGGCPSFNPTASVSVVDNWFGRNSGVTFDTDIPGGNEFLDLETFRFPADWNVAEGSSLPDGTQIGEGAFSLVYGGQPVSDTFRLINLSDTLGHHARWRLLFGTFPSLDAYVDGDVNTGYFFTTDPVVSGLDTPLHAVTTIYGQVAGIPIVTNPETSGQYTWGFDFRSLTGQSVVRQSTIAVEPTYAQIITAGAGETFQTGFGDTLSVPAGALASNTTISLGIGPLPAPAPAGIVALPYSYRFGPPGLTFNSPVTFVLPYKPTDLGTADPSSLRVYFLDSQTSSWDLVGGVVNTVEHTVTVQLTHFSTYALMYSLPPPVGGVSLDPAALPPHDGAGRRIELPLAVAAAGALAMGGAAWYARRRRRT